MNTEYVIFILGNVTLMNTRSEYFGHTICIMRTWLFKGSITPVVTWWPYQKLVTKTNRMLGSFTTMMMLIG